jgi:hypothetical protein
VIVWLATVRLAVLKLAVVAPPLVLSVPCPILVPPSEKITMPVGFPGAVLLTVAVKVTPWPHADGLAEATSAVLLPALDTVCVMAVEALAAKLPSPL